MATDTRPASSKLITYYLHTGWYRLAVGSPVPCEVVDMPWEETEGAIHAKPRIEAIAASLPSSPSKVAPATVCDAAQCRLSRLPNCSCNASCSALPLKSGVYAATHTESSPDFFLMVRGLVRFCRELRCTPFHLLHRLGSGAAKSSG